MRHTDKQFLSESPDESGSMICVIETKSKEEILSDGWRVFPEIEARVVLRACYGEPVQIDLDVRSTECPIKREARFNKRVQKLDKMIEMLQNMRHSLVEVWPVHQREVEEANEEIKKGNEDD